MVYPCGSWWYSPWMCCIWFRLWWHPASGVWWNGGIWKIQQWSLWATGNGMLTPHSCYNSGRAKARGKWITACYHLLHMLFLFRPADGNGKSWKLRLPKMARLPVLDLATVSRWWVTSATCLEDWLMTARTPKTTSPGTDALRRRCEMWPVG